MSLKIQYCSDLHLEFYDNNQLLKTHPIKAVGDILLLAGDIVLFSEMERHKVFFDDLSNRFKMVYWIPGNHEYYNFDAINKSGILNERIRDNVFLVNNITIELENVRLIFSTLWSKISQVYENQIAYSLSDFRVIKYNGERLSIGQYNQLHEDSLNFITNEINKAYVGKTVVVTHHVPTYMNYPEQYRGSALSEAFTVELFDLIEASNIDCWIYGHHHSNTPEFIIGKTRMLTNQLGYLRYNEHINFDPTRLVVI